MANKISQCLGGIGSIWGSQYHQQNRVYSMGDIALCHPASIPGGSYNYLEIRKVDSMYGQNTIAEQSRAEQRLGNLYGMSGGNYAGQVYNPDGIAPTLTDMQGGGRQPHIVEVNKMGRMIKIRQATKNGFIDLEVPGIADLEYPTSQTRRGRVLRGGQISPTLQTESIPSLVELGSEEFHNFLYEIDGQIYLIRIRKLIPLECWRLMGFSDEDFHKAEAVNSNTQLYKQAGNSIVKNCLVAIFGQMFEGKEDYYKHDRQ